MRSYPAWVPAVVVTFLSTGSVRVAAAEPIDGRVRLGLEGGLIEYHTSTITYAANPSTGAPSRESDIHSTTVGLGSIPFGPVIAYGLSENVMLGARLEIVNRSRRVDDQEANDTLGAALYGTLAYVGGTGALRPFVGPLLGFEIDDGAGPSSEFYEQHFVFGIQAGLHAFATTSFSIDPSVVLGYMLGSGHGSTINLSTAGSSYEYDFNGFIVGFRVALSGWLGGKSEEPKEPAEPPDYYPPATYPAAPYPPSYPAYPQTSPQYPQQQPAYPQQQPGYPQQQPAYPQQQPGYQAPPSSPPPTSSSPSPALPPPPPAR
jgi:hypothetical protein